MHQNLGWTQRQQKVRTSRHQHVSEVLSQKKQRLAKGQGPVHGQPVCRLAQYSRAKIGHGPSHVNMVRLLMYIASSSVYFPPLSSCSEQVCLESSDLLHMHLALAGKWLIIIVVTVEPT